MTKRAARIMADKSDKTEMVKFNSYDYAFMLGLQCGADYTQKELQQEIEETRELYKAEIRREAKTFERLVWLRNRTNELATMLWGAIKTIRDQDIRRSVIREVNAGFDRIEASDQQHRHGRARPERS